MNFFPITNPNAIDLLVSMARYSENPLCKNRSKFYLSSASAEDKMQIAVNDGHLMIACLEGNIDQAYNHASSTSIEAIRKVKINHLKEQLKQLQKS